MGFHLEHRKFDIIDHMQECYQNVLVIAEMKRDDLDPDTSCKAKDFLNMFLLNVRESPLSKSGPFSKNFGDVLLLIRLSKCVSRQNSLAFLSCLSVAETSVFDEFVCAFDMYVTLLGYKEEAARGLQKKTN